MSRIHIFMILSALVAVISCTNYHENWIPVGLSIDKKTISFSENIDSQSLHVISDSEWEVVLPDWISVLSIDSSRYLEYEWTITVSTMPNSEYDRNGEIVFKNQSNSQTVIVMQKGKKGKMVVDMGLPSGLKWATCNVGASFPDEYGDYYAWGETEPKNDYSLVTYKWCMGSVYTMTKYCFNFNHGYNGFTDDKTILDLKDDAAHVNWGGNWRMPTVDEWAELLSQCVWEWTTMNEVFGYKVTGPNGNCIFLPAARFREMTALFPIDACVYWSSSLYPAADDYAMCGESLNRSSYEMRCYPFSRNSGLTIRPVCD